MWEYEGEHGYTSYDAYATITIETAYARGDLSVILDQGFYASDTYTVTLSEGNMSQRNNRTSNTRSIRRRVLCTTEILLLSLRRVLISLIL